ncbi:hypothetical protein RchiOBHm_Chr3g0469351 [Rosa chinensis]|uniref:Late embryogenesis abundant protein, LEA-14 n=1 Tax=Rosa chinensis TaxID=74649 RepID=A0A2P6RAR3_ROSCH|nr:hypothetical protein RchiOBHm_Chr3g0469351 [Rosa chinensis]
MDNDDYKFYLKFTCGIFSLIPSVLLAICCGIHHRPHIVELNITQASLSCTNFTTTFATNDTLHYNLDLNITLRNSNKFYSVHHQKIEALTYYRNQGYGYTTLNLNSFSQEAMSDAVPTPMSFKEQHSVIDPAAEDEDIVVVKLYLENKYKTRVMGWQAKSEFARHLRVVPSINGLKLAASSETAQPCNNIDHRLSFPKPLKFYLKVAFLTASMIWLLRIM